jgi:hypothetical protein
MDALVHRCIASMIVRVYGSLATQWISGGQLRIMQRALGGEHFSWGLMLHAKMVGQLNRCRAADSGEFSFGSILVAWFLERVPMLCPRVLLDAPGYARAVTEVVGDDSGSPWWWGGWPLFHGRGCTGVVSDATDHTSDICILGWTFGMIQIWCYPLERCSTTEV